MMNLNKNNGNIEFKGYVIKPTDKFQDLKKIFLRDDLELWIENNNWITYKLDITKEFILLIKLFKDNIRTVEIYFKSQIDQKSENILISFLKNLGGENKYQWGNVEVNKDKKAGYESIIINFIS